MTAESLAARMEDLIPIGLSERGTNRMAWTSEDAQARQWFERQAQSLGLRAERDVAGNLWALPPVPGPWWATGSHLDSVRNGGRFDGALGVAAGFEIAAATELPIAVISFADEEGARFNTPTFGSKALAGTLNVVDILGRQDDEGVELASAMAAAGLDPAGLSETPTLLNRLLGFVELHIDQTRDLEMAGSPVGVVSSLASRLRLQVEITGRADHSGTTHGSDRSDAVEAAARLIVEAYDAAPDIPGFAVTASRILVEPNALTTVPSNVSLSLDARSASLPELRCWRDALEKAGDATAERVRVDVSISEASRSEGTTFDQRVRTAMHCAANELIRDPVPELLCFAGHDAGVLANRVPAGMVLVRNKSGISHAPDEEIDLEDAAVAANVLMRTLEIVARAP